MRKKICLFLVISFFLNFSGITVLATDPPVRPEEMIGSADVRYVVDSLRETVWAGNTPGTGILILLNAMKEKISTQLSTAQESYPEVVGPISDTDQTKIESIIAEGIAKTNELIEKISAVIATPVEEIRVEQLDAIILMLDDAADMQGNILSTKPDLPNKLVSGTKEFKTRPVKATGADPTPEDLIETPEIQITPRIQEVADNLNNDPVKIFTWVRNNIDYEPYYGSLKGSNETLIDMAGNDCDQSSLLIALLRASDIPARYVRGDVELKIEDLMNWTGGETPEAAVKIMQSNWIPTQVLYKFDAIEGVIFDHIWVEIFDGHVWRLADPSYKEYVYTEGTEITSEQKDALANLMEGTVTISEDEKSFSANQELIEFAMEEAARILEGSVNSGREILVNEKNNLPPYLARGIIGDRKPAEEFAEMPDDMRFKVRVAFPDLEAHTFLMADVAGKTLSITYEMQQMPWLP
jgi:transglutaminase-like putative cysteine protease